MNINALLQDMEDFELHCVATLGVIAKIREIEQGKYRVLSEDGKNMGTYKSKDKAKARLKQIEFFKHLDNNKANDEAIDLTDADEVSYSAIMRKLNEKATQEQMLDFMKLFKLNFDKAIKAKLHKPDRIALQKTLVLFNKVHPIKLDKDMVKNAAIAELGNAEEVGKYLADIVKFTINRISPDNRQKSLNNLKQKFMELNPNDIGQKQMPASSALGQAITFTKHILFGHDANYVKKVLESLSRAL